MSRSAPLRVHLLAAAAGGALGALGRYAATAEVPVGPEGFPWATFTVNVVGCALLALLPAWPPVHRHHWLPAFLGTGLLGGFTTMSTASTETFVLLDAGRVGVALAYLLGTLAAALLAVILVDRLSTPADRLDFAEQEGDE